MCLWMRQEKKEMEQNCITQNIRRYKSNETKKKKKKKDVSLALILGSQASTQVFMLLFHIESYPSLLKFRKSLQYHDIFNWKNLLNILCFLQPAHEKIGVVDSQWVVHQVVPSLGNQVSSCEVAICLVYHVFTDLSLRYTSKLHVQ